jgi:hypothetical protein
VQALAYDSPGRCEGPLDRRSLVHWTTVRRHWRRCLRRAPWGRRASRGRGSDCARPGAVAAPRPVAAFRRLPSAASVHAAGVLHGCHHAARAQPLRRERAADLPNMGVASSSRAPSQYGRRAPPTSVCSSLSSA